MNRWLILALVAIGLTSCNLLEIFRTTAPDNDGYWYIKNETPEPVYVRGYSNDGTEPVNILLDKGDSVKLFFYGVDIRLLGLICFIKTIATMKTTIFEWRYYPMRVSC